MGQYWLPVSLDKREFINPHQLGAGLKQRRSVYHHGIVVFPPRERNPLKVIDRIYRETVAANPEEWMYDDILAALRKMGCEIIRPHCWVEPN